MPSPIIELPGRDGRVQISLRPEIGTWDLGCQSWELMVGASPEPLHLINILSFMKGWGAYGSVLRGIGTSD